MTTSSEELDSHAPGKLPYSDEPLWVQCEGFRCLAFLDKQGQWRAFYDRSKLAGTIKIIAYPTNH